MDVQSKIWNPTVGEYKNKRRRYCRINAPGEQVGVFI